MPLRASTKRDYDRTLKQLQTDESTTYPVRIWDRNVPGLVLQVQKSGYAAWKFTYSYCGKQRWYALGRWEHRELSEVRQRARSLGGQVADGRDPQGERMAEREAARGVTFGKLAQDFFLAKPENVKETSWKTYQNLYRSHLKPLADKPVAQLTRYDFQRIVDDMAARGRSGSISPTVALASKIVRFGVAREKYPIETNVVRDVERPGHTTRQRRALDDAEMRKLWDALDAINEPWNAVLLTQMFTGCRISEAVNMRWENFSTDLAWFALPENKTSTPHWLFVPQTIRDVLPEPRARGNVWMEKPRKFPSNATARLRQITGISDFEPHTLRVTFKTTLASLGISQEIRDMALNHAKQGMDAVYNKYTYAAEIRDAVIRVESAYLTRFGFTTPSYDAEADGSPRNIITFPLQAAAAEG